MMEGPYDLPPGWRWVHLGDIFEVQQGAAMSPKRRRGLSPMPFLRTSNIRWGKVDITEIDYMDFTESEQERLALKKGDLLVCEGGEVGRTAIWNCEIPVCFYQNHIHRLRALSKDIAPKFFMYWMQAAYQIFMAYTGEESRTAIPNLSGRRLKAFLVPCPPPEEQRRIVAKLDEIMAQIQEARRLRAEARKDAELLMQSALAEVFPHPGSDLPPGWRWLKMGQIAEVVSGFGFPKKYQGRKDLPYPFVKVSDMNLPENETIISTSQNFIDDDILRKIGGRIFPKGTVIFPKIGGAIATNKKRILGIPGTFDNNVMGLIPKHEGLHEKYLYYFINTVNLVSFSQIGPVPSLKRSAITEIDVPFPPIEEQLRIVTELDKIKDKMADLTRCQTRSEETLIDLERSALEHAFRGEI